jgi:hypothetical protein
MESFCCSDAYIRLLKQTRVQWWGDLSGWFPLRQTESQPASQSAGMLPNFGVITGV